MSQLPTAARPPDTLKVRGRLRGVWLALWLAGAAGCVAVGLSVRLYGDTPEDTLGPPQIFLSFFLFLAALLVVVAVRSFGRGLDANGNGVVVRNMLRARPIRWRELATIEFKGVDSEAMQNMYYQLVFQRHDGSRVTPRHPAVEHRRASTSSGSGSVLSPCETQPSGITMRRRTGHWMPSARTRRLPLRLNPPRGFRRPGRAAPTRRMPFQLRRRGAESSVGAVLLPLWRWR
jgi:hypothetical protein